MHNALNLFRKNIEEAESLTPVYEYLERSLSTPLSFDDLLRAQIVYSVSAFDKLMHDLIRIGMVEIFMGNRPTTPQYLAETITISTYSDLISATFLPKELVFEQAIVRKLKTVSYQTPDNVAKGLSYIWNEPQKWQKIATNMAITNMAMDTETVKTELKLIVDQRNRIVHEADINPLTNQKYSITKNDSQSVTDFLQKAGEAIYMLVL
jgi:hypothetical protein